MHLDTQICQTLLFLFMWYEQVHQPYILILQEADKQIEGKLWNFTVELGIKKGNVHL